MTNNYNPVDLDEFLEGLSGGQQFIISTLISFLLGLLLDPIKDIGSFFVGGCCCPTKTDEDQKETYELD